MLQSCGAFPRQQRRAIALRDSKLVSLREGGEGSGGAGEVRVRLSAYVLVGTGAPGRGAGTAWSQELELVFAEAVVETRPEALPLWLTEGALTFSAAEARPAVPDDSAQEDLIALPLDRSGELCLRLAGDEATLVVRGRRVVVLELDDPRFIERLPRDES